MLHIASTHSSRTLHWSPLFRSLAVLLLLLPALWVPQAAAQAADGDPKVYFAIADDTIYAESMTSFTVDVMFTDKAATNNISAVSFGLDFDQSCLVFDPTDGDANNIPDSITGTLADYNYIVAYDAGDTTGEIDVTVTDQTGSQDALADDVKLATFQFGIQPSCRTSDGSTRSLAFKFSTTPAPTYGSTTGGSVTGDTLADLNVTLSFNANPTDLGLSASTVNENVTLGTTIGTLSTTDPDTGDTTFIYSLVSGQGATDNAAFTIDGANLKTNTALNYELKNSYSIRVRTTDPQGGTYEEAFTITVNNVNEAPTSLSISGSSINENVVGPSDIGTFSALDPDSGETFTYTLVSGTGATDNNLFTISGITLSLTSTLSFDYEAKSVYSIRVAVTDSGNSTLANIFAIHVKNVNDAPVAVADTLDPAVKVITGATDIFVLSNDSDQDIGDTIAINTVGSPSDGGAAAAIDAYIRYTPTASYNGPVTFSYTAKDASNLSSNSANVTVQVVKNDARGDCNSDGSINAGDFPAFILEDDDTDLSTVWYNSYSGGFSGSPLGCDANADKAFSLASDLTCAVLISFDNSCSPAVAASADAPAAELTVGQDIIGARNGAAAVPVFLKTNGHNIAAASFKLDIDESQLAFDPADSDGNGVPDAISFQTPAGMVTAASYDAATGRLQATVYAVSLPMPKLGDGVLANVTVQINEQATAAVIPIDLTEGSLGSDQGQSVPVEVQGGSLRIEQMSSFLFLPTLNR